MIPWARKDKAWLVVAACILPLLAVLQVRLGEMPEQVELQEAAPFEELPPSDFLMEYVGSIMLGGFRAIAVDFLWIRAERLTKEKKWEELRTVYEAIARLQPRMVEVYIHNSWNMAYNVSNLFEDPETKVKWVQAGIQYAKRGMRLNPREEKLPHHVGYLYWHRVPRNEHMHGPPSEDRVMELIEAMERRCAYETAIEYFEKAQLLYEIRHADLAAIVDVYQGMTMDATYHRAWHTLGSCAAKSAEERGSGRWEVSQQRLDDAIRFCRYVDDRYHPGTTFWADRIQYLQRLKAILETERDAETIEREDGLEAVIPALWQLVADYKALKQSKPVFRQGSVERRLRRAMFKVCLAGYGRLERGDPAGARQLWAQVIEGCQSGMNPDDPYHDSWVDWGEGVRMIEAAFADEAAALAAGKTERLPEAAAHARAALAVYDKVLDVNGLMEIPLFLDRAEALRKMTR